MGPATGVMVFAFHSRWPSDNSPSSNIVPQTPPGMVSEHRAEYCSGMGPRAKINKMLVLSLVRFNYYKETNKILMSISITYLQVLMGNSKEI